MTQNETATTTKPIKLILSVSLKADTALGYLDQANSHMRYSQQVREIATARFKLVTATQEWLDAMMKLFPDTSDTAVIVEMEI